MWVPQEAEKDKDSPPKTPKRNAGLPIPSSKPSEVHVGLLNYRTI